MQEAATGLDVELSVMDLLVSLFVASCLVAWLALPASYRFRNLFGSVASPLRI